MRGMIRLRDAALGIALALFGCSSATTGGGAPEDAGDDALEGAFDAADAADAGGPVIVEAGPLWQTCDPADPASCPSGLECLDGYTSPFEAYGKCVFPCTGSTLPACTLSGGVCICPVPALGATPNCAEGNEAGAVTVCVPAGEAGVSGNNEIEDSGESPPSDLSDGGDAAG